MPSRLEHEEQAARTTAAIDSTDPEELPDWVMTMCFYRAVHLVESFLAVLRTHSESHDERNGLIRILCPDIWLDYLIVLSRSRSTRNDCIPLERATAMVENTRDRVDRIADAIAARISERTGERLSPESRATVHRARLLKGDGRSAPSLLPAPRPRASLGRRGFRGRGDGRPGPRAAHRRFRRVVVIHEAVLRR